MKYWIRATNEDGKIDCCVQVPLGTVLNGYHMHNSRPSPDWFKYNTCSLKIIRSQLLKLKKSPNLKNCKIYDYTI